MAATLALRDGNPDSVRAQLPPQHHASFDLAYQVQLVRDGGEGRSRLDRRTEDEAEKRRAARNAAALIAEEERRALREGADGEPFELLSSLDLENLEDAEPLIEGFLVKESVVRLYGPPKSYKSFVMLDMAGCVGAGIPWAGNRCVPAKVLYVVAEGVRGIKRRVRAWEAQNKRTMTGVHFYPKAVQLGERKDVQTLIATARRGKYEFIILDTQARCTVGLEENSASEMGLVVAALDVLKEVTGACVALVHHSGVAGGRARGSNAILGALDAEFEVEADKDNMSVRVITRAQKDLAEAKEIELDLVTPAPGAALAVKMRPKWYRARPEDMAPLPVLEHSLLNIIVAFGPPGGTEQMINMKLTGDADRATVREALGQLMRKGCVAQKGTSWRTTREGERRIGGIHQEGD